MHKLIPCPHCAKPSKIDPGKLTGPAAFFSCPHCGGRVVVDRQTLVESGMAATSTGGRAGIPLSADAEPQSPPARTGIPLSADPEPPTAPPRAAPPQVAPAQAAPQPVAASPREAASPAPPVTAAPPEAITPPAVEPTVPDRRFAQMPDDAILPSGIIVGEDPALIAEVREALAALGSNVDAVESADAARTTIANEQPKLCIYVAGRIESTPHLPMVPLTRLQPGLRRDLYLMLVADNVKTFDANAAFMHEVNMVLGRQDLSQIGGALFSGLAYHDRLYRAYRQSAG